MTAYSEYNGYIQGEITGVCINNTVYKAADIMDTYNERDKLKAENERLREALQDVANLYQPHTPIQRAINIARIALNMETSNDKG